MYKKFVMLLIFICPCCIADSVDHVFLAKIKKQVSTGQPQHCDGETMICLNAYFTVDFKVIKTLRGPSVKKVSYLDSDHYGYPFDKKLSSRYLVFVGKNHDVDMVLKDIAVFKTTDKKLAITGMSAINKLDEQTCHKLLKDMYFKGMSIADSLKVDQWPEEDLQRYNKVIEVIDNHVVQNKGVYIKDLSQKIDYDNAFTEGHLIRCISQ